MNAPVSLLPRLTLALAAALSASCVIYVRADDDDFDVEARSFSNVGDWDGPRVRGNGQPATEDRGLAEVSAVRAEGAIDVVVEVGRGPSLVVQGDSNVLEHVRTEVSGDRLTVRLARGSYELREPLRVTVGTQSLREVAVVGSGDVAVAGLSGDALDASVTGSGDLALAGSVRELNLAATGSGDIDATDLGCAAAEVLVNGSGDVELGEVEALVVALSGSGDVRYTGKPASIQTEVNGSGAVRAR